MLCAKVLCRLKPEPSLWMEVVFTPKKKQKNPQKSCHFHVCEAIVVRVRVRDE